MYILALNSYWIFIPLYLISGIITWRFIWKYLSEEDKKNLLDDF